MLVQVIMTDGTGDIIGRDTLVSDLAKIYRNKTHRLYDSDFNALSALW